MGRNPEILIADADDEVARLLGRRLVEDGCRVETVRTGQAALEWLAGEECDLILLDLRLPDMTGQELLDALGEREQEIPFIVVSGLNDVALTVTMMKRGALDFVQKDSNFLELVAPVVRRGLETVEVARRYDESRLRLKFISDTILDVFWMTCAKTRKVLYASQAYEKIWGRPLEALYANPDDWTDAIIGEDRSKVIRNSSKLMEGRETEYNEVYRIRDKLGEARWIHDRGFANLGPDGEVRYLTGIATDITERKMLEGQVVEAAEVERNRIGQDLHDDLCQSLAALKLRCGMIQGELEKESSRHAEALEGVIEELQKAAAFTRTLAKGLSPVSIETDGLMGGLKQLAEVTEERYGISCHFDSVEPVEVEDSTKASNVFRIAQELVNNAAKHANPKRILIGLYKAMGGFRLEVTNDGKPFYGPKRRREGMGLHFVQFRADSMGASIEFFPGDPPDGGLRVVCVVPLVKRESERKQKG